MLFTFGVVAISWLFTASALHSNLRLKSYKIKNLHCTGDIPESVETCDFTGRGCVILAHQSEHDHFLHKAAVLIFENDPQKGSKGAILGRPSAFTLGDTAPNMPEPLQPNTLFIGGSGGQDMAIMFHKYEFGGASKPIGNGIYLGALKEAREALEAREKGVHPRDFKFIFNNVEWPPGALEREIAEGRWDVVRMPPDMVLQQKDGSAEAIWSAAKSKISLAL